MPMGGKVNADEPGRLSPALQKYVETRISEFDKIPEERKEQLKKMAEYVQSHTSAGQHARLTFICTHNSRRSHMGMLWAAVAAAYYHVPNVETFSGGTEATAFNPRAIGAMQRAGFKIEPGAEKTNPREKVFIGTSGEPLVCFSKVYDSEPNPKSDFCAVMTCAQADKNCPLVRGATQRIAITYEDPKASDGTPQEAATYDERCAQIAREVLYAFSLVKS
jgi:protein-tyrosine-phosphatase